MRITTFTVSHYRGSPIYFRHFGDTFEYLFIARNQIFTDRIRAKPGLVGRFLRVAGRRRTPYSDELLQKVIAMLMGKARERMDYVCSKEYEKDLRKMKRDQARSK